MMKPKAYEHLSFINKALNHPKQTAAIERLKRVSHIEWGLDTLLDGNHMLLGCPNGIVDLTTGQCRPGRREDLVTKCIGIPYDANADCPRFLTFLDEIFDGDAELTGFIRRAFGYTLTGQTGEQVMFILHGTGANGKSVLVETLKTVMGKYANTTPFITFAEKNRSDSTNDLAALAGARMVVASESEETAGLNESRIKRLTGGDEVAARFLYNEFFGYVPTFKIWLSLNHKPRVTGTDEGIWRRLLLSRDKHSLPNVRIQPA